MMPNNPALALWALLLACSTAAVQALRTTPASDAYTCEPEYLAAADISTRTCQMNWALANRSGPLWRRTPKFDCWTLRGYNTDTYFSSTVYQNNQGRCALALSGYHIEPPEYQEFRPTGYVRGGLDIMWPPVVWNVCGFTVYAPYVRMLREHTALSNWSKLVNFIAGNRSTCVGELLFISSSLGGAAGEVLAGCANKGLLHEVMNKSLPSFHLPTLYTFGSPPPAIEPIKNALRADGCFKGKRIYSHDDHVPQYGFGLHHAHMDSVELWPVRYAPGTAATGFRKTVLQPSLKKYRCGGPEAVENAFDQGPPSPKSKKPYAGEFDPTHHTITGLRDQLQWFHDAGQSKLFAPEVTLPAPAPKILPQHNKSLSGNHSGNASFAKPFAPMNGLWR